MNNIYIPKENVSDTSAKVTELYFDNKALVSQDDVIASVETSKAIFEVEAENSGYILYRCREGDDCPINDVIAIVFDSIEELETYEAKNEMKSTLHDNLGIEDDYLISDLARDLLVKYNISIHEIDAKLISSETIMKLIAKRQNLEIAKFQPQDVVLVGTGGAAEMVADAINHDINGTYNIAGYIDDFSDEAYHNGLPVYGAIDVLETLRDKGLNNLVLSFGFIGHLDKRKKLFERYKDKINFPNIIDSNAYVEKSVKLGHGNIILGNAYIGSKAEIGNLNIVNTGALISHETVVKDGNHFTPRSTVAGQVKIGSLNIFGMNCSILMKTVIGSNVKVNNNVATTSNIKSNTILKI